MQIRRLAMQIRTTANTEEQGSYLSYLIGFSPEDFLTFGANVSATP